MASPRAGAALIVTGLVLAGCAGRMTMPQWVQSSGIVGLDQTVSGDLNDIAGARRADEPAVVQTLCDALFQDAAAAYLALPSPDEVFNTEINNADLNIEQGAQNCSTSVGVPGAQPSAVAQAYALLAEGTRQLDQATARLEHLEHLGTT